MIDLVEHLPIKEPGAKTLQLRQQALGALEDRAARLGYEVLGQVRFRVIELPLSMYLECRALVEPPAIETLILDRMRRGRL
ncbi:hypothetical protein [Arthrobacter glacialis]|uniref:hypothetical protein n=1 Tax=Arthrobacter glacialis TaxID=1664 RepID=UPI000CD42A99|nr:hypothetical protein [Arthrobacter glacialis]POH58905.1 hypothetical protein CVS28_09355 [Arthrobacter glacialis]